MACAGGGGGMERSWEEVLGEEVGGRGGNFEGREEEVVVGNG